MAHTIVAADLGGTGIKLVRVEASFRRMSLLDARVIASPFTGRPEERVPQQLQALAHYLHQEKLEAEEIVLGLPGDALTFRLADLPFSNPRQIESVLSYELESQILTPVEELVLDFVIVGRGRQPAPEAEAQAQGNGETRVLVAAASRALIATVVKTAADLGLPLRTIGAAPLACSALLSRGSEEPSAEAAPDGEAAPAVPPLSLVLDLGAEQTSALIVRGGAPLMARSIARGGRQLTEAIAGAFRLDPAQAEKAKLEAGFVAHAGSPRLTPSQAHMDEAVRKALLPLLRELRQTLASFRASYGEGVDRILVTGGSSRLPGLCEHFTEELGLPSSRLPWPVRDGFSEDVPEQADELSGAAGMALGVHVPTSQVNFRKGDFAYRSDFSFVRGKAVHLAVAGGLILLFSLLDGWASYRGERKDHELLAARLRKATVEVFGKERDDLSRISEELKEGPKASAQVPIPSYTAFDLVEEMSRLAPPSDKIRLDIEELDIKPRKIQIRGTTETAQQVDDLAEAFRKVECFEEVQKGKLVKRTIIAPTPADVPGAGKDKDKDKDKGPTELTQFTLTIKGSCP